MTARTLVVHLLGLVAESQTPEELDALLGEGDEATFAAADRRAAVLALGGEVG